MLPSPGDREEGVRKGQKNEAAQKMVSRRAKDTCIPQNHPRMFLGVYPTRETPSWTTGARALPIRPQGARGGEITLSSPSLCLESPKRAAQAGGDSPVPTGYGDAKDTVRCLLRWPWQAPGGTGREVDFC